jgi:hypothetical protein
MVVCARPVAAANSDKAMFTADCLTIRR